VSQFKPDFHLTSPIINWRTQHPRRPGVRWNWLNTASLSELMAEAVNRFVCPFLQAVDAPEAARQL